ncbi:winged helix-turn-helix domain-containing protein [Amycolatopsis thermoflava]|uniref:winged helix-turn-helix domain-containing protein n=1 Tax=Amycolatopsis thermoflava TaxID=84480 RepID=UPI0036631BE4
MNRELSATGPAYLYDLVADDLARRIETGELAVNTPLPAEQTLARQYGVSLGTCRHATKVLRDRGLVRTIPSKGTFVAEQPNRAAVYCFEPYLVA